MGNKTSDLFERNLELLERKKESIRRTEEEMNEECYFHPLTLSTVRRGLSRANSSECIETAHDRLYNLSKKKMMKSMLVKRLDADLCRFKIIVKMTDLMTRKGSCF
jgi:hypothetical protein